MDPLLQLTITLGGKVMESIPVHFPYRIMSRQTPIDPSSSWSVLINPPRFHYRDTGQCEALVLDSINNDLIICGLETIVVEFEETDRS